MEILVQPISSGKIVVQISNYIKLRTLGYHPEVIFGASGGAACGAIIASSFDDNPLLECANILEKVIELESHFFVKKRSFIPSMLEPIIYKSLYEKGKEIPDRIFKLKEKYPEFYISTYSESTGKLTIFRKTENPKIKFIDSNDFIDFYDIESFEMYKDVTRASCSIPCYLPPVKINNSNYFDGGTISPSPLGGLSLFLPKHVKIIYNCPFNIFSLTPDLKDASNTLDILRGYLIEINTGHIISDIHLGIALSNFDTCAQGYTLGVGMGIYNKCKSCFMLLYPAKDNSIDINNFTKDQFHESVIKSLNIPTGYKIWYQR